MLWFRSDQKAAKKEQETGFCPPDRPKCYRKKALEVLEQSVQNRSNVMLPFYLVL